MKQTILIELSKEELQELISSAVDSALKGKLQLVSGRDPKYYTRREVCKLLKITLPTLGAYQKAGKIRGFRLGRRVLFDQESVSDALKQIQTK